MLTRRWLSVWVLVALLFSLAAAPLGAQGGEVRILLFWDEYCPNCEIVLRDVLPALEEQYGSQLDVVRVEVSSVPAYDLFMATTEYFDVPEERQGVPLLVVGDKYMLGWEEIEAGLAPEIEKGISSGGLDVPPELGLTDDLAATLASASGATWAELHGTDGIANTAALGVLSMLSLSLIYVGTSVRRAPSRSLAETIEKAPTRQSVLVPILAIAGLAVAGYLSYVEFTGSNSYCPVGRCEAVQHSVYSSFFGIPTAVMGVVAYAAILALWVVGEKVGGTIGGAAPLGVFGVSFIGTIFSLYLTYLELFVIKAVCMWCLMSAVVITLILLVSLRWMLPSEHGGSDLAAQEPA